jgi:hypothetical protein
LPPSQHNWLAGVTTPDRTALTDARSSLGNTASMVAPARSRATRTGICSAERPVFSGLPPRVRAARGRSARLPLNDSRMNVSSAWTMPFRRVGLSSAGAARTPLDQSRIDTAATGNAIRATGVDVDSSQARPRALPLDPGQVRRAPSRDAQSLDNPILSWLRQQPSNDIDTGFWAAAQPRKVWGIEGACAPSRGCPARALRATFGRALVLPFL